MQRYFRPRLEAFEARLVPSATQVVPAHHHLDHAGDPHPGSHDPHHHVASQIHDQGTGTLTDDTGAKYGLEYKFSAKTFADGSVQGHISFTFSHSFSRAWGAVPGVDLIHLEGTVTAMSVAADGTVTLQGTETETDFTKGKLVYTDVMPFTIVVSPGGQHFTLQWCELPTFGVQTNNGHHQGE